MSGECENQVESNNDLQQNQQNDNKNELNERQNEFAMSPLEDSKLLGIPGGGKTTTIIYYKPVKV